MKTKETMLLILLGILLISITPLTAQIASSKEACNTNCFNTEIIKAEKNGECVDYEFKVSYDGKCAHALSHYTVAIPCGDVKNLTNSSNWKQVFGYDPTTKLTGFKIDDIPNFGETSLKSFNVKFTLCSNSTACDSALKCWEPLVAYKAGTSVYYDTLETTCQNIAASLQQKNASCFGAADGMLTVVVTEGQEPFTYTWSTGDSTSSISNLIAGNYTVTVGDASGSQVELTATISQPEAIIISGTVTNASCNGKADGAIDISVSGGGGGYSYSWNNGATTEDLSAIKSGIYAVTVKDSIGCSAQKTFSVTNASQILISAVPALPACNQANGSINITVSGGIAPYTYLWSTGAATEDIQNLSAGLYKVTITDSTGCSANFSYNLRENNTLKLNALVTQTSCLDDASGAVDLITTGGTAPYTYSWSNGATTEDLAGLSTGLYKVTVTDANGCTATLQVNVSKKTFQVSSQIVQPLCHNDSTGSITLIPSAGVEPYTYQWSNGATGNSLTGLASGVYYATITDSTGCSRSLTFIISNPSIINASTSVTNNQCSTEGSYSIDLTVTGGKAPYSYAWSTGDTSEDLDSLQSGTYFVTIKDANGCSATKEVIVSGSSTGWTCLIVQPDSIPVCNSISNTLNASVQGATSYQWSVQSSDGKWAITSNTSSESITYTAGDVSSSATFALTIVKDGCTQTCSYTATTCTTQDDGGNDGGGTNDETCDECFDSSVTLVSTDGSCKTYEVIVSTDGNCRHELSHWDIAIPCGTVKNTWNSGGWKMEIGTDPTTGITGLKVDGVNDFGKEAETFKVKFTICGDNSCNEILHDWDPLVAYKAGLCIAIDTLGHDESNTGNDDGNTDEVKICAYPNPFHNNLKFEWKCDENDYVELDIIDKCGKEVHKVYEGNVWKGESYSFECSDEKLKDDIYIYRFASSKKKTQYGKLMRKR